MGAKWDNTGGIRCGRAFVYFGGPGGDSTADLVLTGENEGDWFGYAVSSAGDFDGDGYGDVIVGAKEAGLYEGRPGRAYVFYGGPDLDGAANLVFTGESSFAHFGAAVSVMPPVDERGCSSLIVGAPFSTGGNGGGRAYVYRGGATADAYPDLILDGEQNSDRFGWSVSGAGDLNADGFADFAVGAYQHGLGTDSAGRVYVYLGGHFGDGCSEFVFDGTAAWDSFGKSVAGAGHLNRDGLSDLIIGPCTNDIMASDAGAGYLFDFNRYQMLAPAVPQTWLVGEPQTITWLGAELADVWLRDGEATSGYLLAGSVGGRDRNELTLVVPDIPSNNARIVLTPSDPMVIGGAESPRLRIASLTPPPDISHRLQFAPTGEGSWEYGTQVGGAGDLNGDGWDD
ncbi:MAG: FG-GAP repeat protein [Candidatus Eisenbacteria sp.]|nr:FG-GAP repeat protein [Candidatus Eisenbacteria bacterium]